MNKNSKDIFILFVTRCMRMFSYGAISVIFFKHLFQKGLSEQESSYLQTLIIVGDIIISIYLTTQADKIGRKKTLTLGALLKVFTGVFYAYSQNFWVLALSGALGVISVTGGQIGPFLPIEQSSLTQIIQNTSRNKQQTTARVGNYFGYYNMLGYLSQAAGAFTCGLYMKFMTQYLQIELQQSMNIIMIAYAGFGFIMMVLYCFLGQIIQPQQPKQKQVLNCAGIQRKSVSTIVQLSILFAIDAWAGGFIMQSFLSYYYEKKFQLLFQELGGMLAVCNIIAGISGIISGKLVARCGALQTMIFTHLPSNIFLLFIPFSSSKYVAVGWLLLRFCISQMDVPARQTYVSMVVSSAERSAANGITNISRSVGLSLAFPLAGLFLKYQPQDLMFSVPFLISGLTKIMYDLAIGILFLWNKRKAEQQSVVPQDSFAEQRRQQEELESK